MVPHVALTYSSNNGDGHEGIGWTVSGLSQITRCPQTIAEDGTGHHGSVNFNVQDRFCLDGQRLILTSGSYGADGSQYHTEIESFRKIVARGSAGTGPAYFDVWTKDGMHYQYGTSGSGGNNSQMLAPDGATVRVWALGQVTDPNGNYISYVWYNWSTYYDYAIKEIDYTGNTANNGTYNSIKFSYGITRNDLVPMYQAGANIYSTNLLSSVSVNHGGTAVWTYTPTYNEVQSGSWWTSGSGGSVWHNQLATLTLCDISGTKCLPTMNFTWQGGPSTWSMSSGTARSLSVGRELMPGDFNGDGLTDILVYDTSSSGDVYLADENGNFGNNTAEQAQYDYWPVKGSKTPYSGSAWFTPYQGTEGYYSVQPPSVLDMDGDGFTDIALPVGAWYDDYVWTNPEIWEILKNNQSGTLSRINSDDKPNYFLYNSEVVGDFDGDGREDLFNWCETATCPIGYGTNAGPELSDGAGDFTLNQNLEVSLPTDASVSVGDFDGSGCSGLLQQSATQSESGEIYDFCELPNGVPGVVSTQIHNWGYSGSGNKIALGDFNGDGKTDILVANSSGATVYLSTGTGLHAYAVCASGCAVSGSSWYNYTIVTGDFNGDGKTDVALISNASGTAHAIYLSTGVGFVAGPTIANSITCNSASVADWNNDGASDLWVQHAACTTGNDTEYTFSYTPELLQQIDDGNGKVTTVSYDRINKGGSLYTDGTGAIYPTQYVDGPIYAVTQVSTSNGIGGTRSWSYNYHGLEKNLQGLGFKGFDKVTVTDNLTGIVKTITYANAWPLYGYPQNETVACCGVQPSVTLANTTYNYYAQNLGQSVGGYWFTLPSAISYQGADLDGTPWPSSSTTLVYDNCTDNNNTWDCSASYGNLYQRTYVNQGDCNHGACFTSQATMLYGYDTADWVLDMPTSSSTTDTPSSGAAITRAMSFTEGSGNNGKPWQIATAVVEPGANDTTNLNASYGYDSWGNLTSTGFSGSQIVARSSGTTYDANGEFPVATTNALSQGESFSLAPYPNQPNTLVDLNGLTTTWTADAFGRPSNTTRPDGSQVNISYYYCNNAPPYACPTNAVFLAVTKSTGRSGAAQNAPTTVAFFDSFGRVVAHDTQSFDGTTFSRVNTAYDQYGNVSEVSRPYFLTSSPKWIQYSYDALGRVTDVLFPDNTENKYTYDALTTTVKLDVNNLNEITTTLRNAEGLVASVTDSNKGVTSYAYDAFGDPLAVTSPDQTQVTNQFDTLGRKTKSVDPDMGTWHYGYDNLGELLTQQSPLESANNLTSLGYDVLGRLVSRTEPDMAASWCYDGTSEAMCTTLNAVGFLVQASCTGAACAGGNGSQNYTRSYAFDTLSRPLSVTIQYGTGSPSYTSTEHYDDTGTGLLSKVWGFSNFTTANVYNPQGYLSSVTNNDGTSTYWTADMVDAAGRLTEETAGNGIVTKRNYDALTGRLTAIAAGNDADNDNIADLSYTWDDVGDLTSRSDNIENYAENFCYDALNRLTNYALFDGGGSTACSGGAINKSIGYDAGFPNGIGDGNITGKSDLGIYTYGQRGAGPHAVSSINTTSLPGSGGCTLSSCKYDGISNPNLLYDADGNVACVTTKTSCDRTAARTYGFTSFDMAITISQGSNTTSFGYSPEHQRGERTTSAGTLYYLSNPAAGVMEELAPGGTQWRSYLAPYGHIVAEMFTASGVTTPYYFVGDHLTSTSALTDQNGNGVETDSYDAWGNRRNPNGNDNQTGCVLNPNPPSKTDRGFTSQEEIDSSCLVNLNARLYDPALGRMLSADPTVPGALNGQAFNRYSYVVNNPLAFVDPSGYSVNCPGPDCLGVHILCTECGNNGVNDGEGVEGADMPCWGCSGVGVDTVATNGDVVSAAEAGYAGLLGVSPLDLASSGWGAIIAAVNAGAYPGWSGGTSAGASSSAGATSSAGSNSPPELLPIQGDSSCNPGCGYAVAVPNNSTPALQPWPFSDFLVQTVAFAGIGKAIEGLTALGEALGLIPAAAQTVKISTKIAAQMASRGWTTTTIDEVVANPAVTSSAVSRLTGNSATAYFDINGGYVVVDDITGDVVQISNLNDPNWVPDSSIINPPK